MRCRIYHWLVGTVINTICGVAQLSLDNKIVLSLFLITVLKTSHPTHLHFSSIKPAREWIDSTMARTRETPPREEFPAANLTALETSTQTCPEISTQRIGTRESRPSPSSHLQQEAPTLQQVGFARVHIELLNLSERHWRWRRDKIESLSGSASETDREGSDDGTYSSEVQYRDGSLDVASAKRAYTTDFTSQQQASSAPAARNLAPPRKRSRIDEGEDDDNGNDGPRTGRRLDGSALDVTTLSGTHQSSESDSAAPSDTVNMSLTPAGSLHAPFSSTTDTSRMQRNTERLKARVARTDEEIRGLRETITAARGELSEAIAILEEVLSMTNIESEVYEQLSRALGILMNVSGRLR